MSGSSMPETSAPAVSRRDPSAVMRLSRLGSMHQCRLSFMRQLTRRMARENWRFERRVFEVDAKGVGHAVYVAEGPKRTYSLVAFAHDLPDELRSDRVIATAWDATFALHDGIPQEADICRLAAQIPLQEEGRVSERELSVSRANRSIRLWAHVVDALAEGRQPDRERVAEVGYLMRTTAVYGSGKFGAADREMIADRPEMRSPFQAEMLSVYLTRWFVRDLVEHSAQIRNPEASVLEPAIARGLGIGNSTGLGMAPFIVNHPALFHSWIQAREDAISRVRAVKIAMAGEVALFHEAVAGCERLVDRWRSEHPYQVRKVAALRSDLAALATYLAEEGLTGSAPWDRLIRWSEGRLSDEGKELVASLILEPYGERVDELCDAMADDQLDAFAIEGTMLVGEVAQLIESRFDWALGMDWQAQKNCARAWYISEEKLEPRLGERFEESIAQYEQPLAAARDAAAAHGMLAAWPDETPVFEFLLRHPEHRHTVRRAQIAALAPYGEIHGNTIGADLMPIDMLRAKLSFFGATQFDPRSDRWVRICMYAGAPYPEELRIDNADFWVFPGFLE